MASYFRREFNYDFVQFSELDDGYVAYLLLEGSTGEYRVIGGLCFFQQEPPEPQWGLHWVWIHPFERRHGRLRALWPFFRNKFGDFSVEYPLSDAMVAFLKCMNEKVD
jgi:hypothetical protein